MAQNAAPGRRTVIFDLDGTLADTSGDLIAAANACFTALGHGEVLDAGADQLTAFHGGRAMLRLGFSRVNGGTVNEADVEREFPNLLIAYEDDIDRHTRLYPGALEAVARLHTAGYAVGICTNKPEGLARLLLTRLGILDRFTSIIGADTLPTRKPDPAPFMAAAREAGGDPARALLVGDTETDRLTARAAGVPCILVGFGPEGPGVARLVPEAMLDHFDDLDQVVADLIG
ncbi:phosphoglycolate phosphatase [Aliiroseovarius zhejiangensis]|uniref:phosphoglycolate phosphatase n=1 Tax=Aliiroseovarius zhejiangensis TaxID=1632025 RepID=A0ABQ3IVS9_9RHOB|nr:HAD-IA family hydrolase [Aliiroseovarius zhejiangensis]GHE93240.1 phosphoglycolate phosphatase [Aliiroseovarius zhejiangensis]